MLMRAHLSAGNPAEALRAYERCRQVMREELGVSPSQETKELRSDVLASM
jgi:DNA-binding SARP family transcriptional activator